METKSVIQICFLDFTLFRENPNFYTTYMFCDINSHTVYSDKLKLSIVDLTQIERATKEDIRYGIDHWARLFKATTWEELKMLAETSEFLKEASEAAYKLSAEEKIRLKCEAREDYYRQQRYIERRMRQLEEAEKKISENEQKLENLKQSLAATEQSLAKTEKILAEKDRQIEFMKEKFRAVNITSKRIKEFF